MSNPLTGHPLGGSSGYYGDLGQFGNSGLGVAGSLRPFRDGLGNASSLSLSATAAKITGDLQVTGDLANDNVGLSVVYLSNALDSSYFCTSWTDHTLWGLDSSTVIQAILDEYGNANLPLLLVVDRIVLAGNLKLWSQTIVMGIGGHYVPGGTQPKSGIIRAAGKLTVFTNKHWADTVNVATVDNAIGIINLNINGNIGTGQSYNGSGGNSTSYQNLSSWLWTGLADFGVLTAGTMSLNTMMFFGVNDLMIEGAGIYDPGNFTVVLAGVKQASIRYYDVTDPYIYNRRNSISTITWNAAYSDGSHGGSSDGFHIWDNCEDIVVENCVFYTSDDPFAVASGETYGVAAWNNIVAPGPVTNVTFRDITLGCTLTAGRCYWYGANTSSAGSRIDNIKFINVHGNVFNNGFVSDLQGQTHAANIGRVSVEGMSLTCYTPTVATNKFACALAISKIEDLSFINCRFDLSNVTSTWTPFYYNNSTNITGKFEINDVRITQDISVDTAYNFVGTDVNNPTPTVASIDISGVDWKRPSSAGTGALLNIAGGTWTDATIENANVDGPNYMVVYSGGTLASLGTARIRHKNAAGLASIALGGNPVVLARLRCACSDTLKLTSTANGASITSHRTDGTEDSYS